MDRPARRKKLGQLLVERGWISGEQLIRAIQSQRVVGGRIGTCLLEMDVLSEDKLLEALSGQLEVPAARIEQLRSLGAEVLDLIPAKLASRWQAIPFAADDSAVQVATLNVKNLSCLDEIEFCTNRRVVPHIAHEARIFEALEKYYGVECPRRYSHLLDRLNRSRYMWDEGARMLLGGGESEWAVDRADELETGAEARLMRPAGGRPTHGLGGPVPGTDATARGRAPADGDPSALTWPIDRTQAAYRTAGGDASTPANLTLDDVERLLAGQTDQRSIGEVLLRFLGQSFSRSAIFAVKSDRIQGWLYRGQSFDSERFRALELTLDQPSAFLGLVKGAELFLGPLAPMPAHRQLARCWGGDLPGQCVMVPIRLRGKLISILYGDRGRRGLSGVAIDQLKQLAEKASIAFELCILRRKLQQQIAGS